MYLGIQNNRFGKGRIIISRSKTIIIIVFSIMNFKYLILMLVSRELRRNNCTKRSVQNQYIQCMIHECQSNTVDESLYIHI